MTKQYRDEKRLTIGVLIGEVNPYTDLIWSGIVDRAQEEDINLVALGGKKLVGGLESKYSHNIIYQLAMGKNVNGAIILTSEIGQLVSLEEVTKFCDLFPPLPVVSIGEEIEGVFSITVDNRIGLHDLICHLIDMHGRRRIGFLQGPLNSVEAQIRYETYQLVLREKGIAFDPELVVAGGFHYNLGRMGMEELLQRGVKFDAVVGINDASAWGALDVLRRHDIQVPYDVSVIGFDDYVESRYTIPPLSTVRQPRYELGVQAVEMILEQLTGREKLPSRILMTEMVLRQSCGCLSPTITYAQKIHAETESALTKVENPNNLIARRNIILNDLLNTLEGDSSNSLGSIREDIVSLLDAIFEDIESTNGSQSLRIFDRILQRSVVKGENLDDYHSVLAIFRFQILQHLNAESEIAKQLELSFQQARITLGNMIQQVQYHHRYQTHLQTLRLFEVHEDVITTFDLPKLMTSLADAFQQLYIPYCFLCLNDDPPDTQGFDKLPVWSRLILAYVDGEQRLLEPGGVRFPTEQILPERILSDHQRYDFYVLPLHFQDHYLGHIVFNINNNSAFVHEALQVYDALQIQISSAIHGAFLIEQLSQARDELEQRVDERTTELKKEIVRRIKFEQNLRENEQLYRALFENTNDAVLILDLEGNVMMPNQQAANLLGYTKEELIYLSIEQLISDPEFFESQEKKRQIFSGEVPPIFERTFRRKDGKLIPTEVSVALAYDLHGQPSHVQSIVRDITHRKRTERLLHALNLASLAVQLANSPDDIFSAVGEEFKKIDIHCTIFLLDNENNKLRPVYYSYDSKAILLAEKILGRDASEFWIDIDAIDIIRRAIRDRETLFIGKVEDPIRALLPKPAKPLVKQFVNILKVPKNINTPLIVEDNVIGLLSVQSDSLQEYDTPAINAFANQMATAWHKANLMRDLEQSLAERRLAESALMESEERFRSVFENAVMGIFRTTPDGRISMANPALVRMMGYESFEELSQINLEKDGYPDNYSRDDLKQQIERDGQVMGFESVWKRRDGSSVFIQESAKAIYDESGNVLYYEGTVEDITQRRQIEVLQRLTEERFNKAFNTSPLAMGIQSLNSNDWGIWLLINKAFTEITGYAHEEVIGYTNKELQLYALVEQGQQANQLFANQGFVREFEFEFRKKSGEIRDGMLWAETIELDEGKNALVLVQDITEKKRIERERRELIEIQRIIATLSARFINLEIIEIDDAIQQTMATIGEQSGVEAVSIWLFSEEKKTGSKRFGWRCDGKPINFTADQDIPFSSISAIFGPLLNFENVVVHDISALGTSQKDLRTAIEQENIISFLAVPLVSEGKAVGSLSYYMEHQLKNWTDEIISLLKLVGDIFVNALERKRAGEAIRKLNEELEQRVVQRTQELQAANQELEAFAYSVSHDLRAPLRAIDGFSLALMEDYSGKFDKEGEGYLQRVRKASQSMAELIDDLLSLSRVTRGEMQRRDVHMSVLAESIMSELRAANPDRRVDFKIMPNLVVNGDERLLRLALANLLGNAWKFTQKKKNAKIEFGQMEIDNRVTYYVKDNGAGFDMTYTDKLFSPFQRLHGVREFEGTGIGLATVQRIIRRHGGSIWADARVDQGATFYFTFQADETMI